MNKLLHRFSDRLIGLRVSLRTRASYVPVLLKKPRVLRRWLLGARAAQGVLVLFVLLMSTAVPPVVDAALEKLYPPTTKKQLFGLFHQVEHDPRLDARRTQVRVALWGVGLTLVLYLLWRYMPHAIRRAEEQAGEHEREADALAHSDPRRSVLLYNSAMALTLSAEREALLQTKLKSLDEDLSLSEVTEPAAPTPPEARKIESVGPGGRYRIERELGRGAMGVVYQAHDTRLDRRIALKQLSSHLSHDRGFFIRFQQEARALARLSHPNIVQVYDFFQDETIAWIAMEFVKGRELGEILEQSGPLAPAEAARLGAQMARAMDYAHEQGVIHRDFKPANVLVTERGETKIMDFGMARLAQSNSHTLAGTLMGSPAYMSPEQGAGEVASARSDVYSLGVTLYEMLTGTVPFEGENMTAVIVQHATKAPEPPRERRPDIPEALDALILGMLAKDPAKRPQAMAAIAEALDGFA